MFDWATAEPNCEVRNSSTATPQALLLMNGDFAAAQAEAFAERLRKEGGAEGKDRVAGAWRLAYGTAPTAKELAGALDFLKSATETFRKVPPPMKTGTRFFGGANSFLLPAVSAEVLADVPLAAVGALDSACVSAAGGVGSALEVGGGGSAEPAFVGGVVVGVLGGGAE